MKKGGNLKIGFIFTEWSCPYIVLALEYLYKMDSFLSDFPCVFSWENEEWGKFKADFLGYGRVKCLIKLFAPQLYRVTTKYVMNCQNRFF